MPTPEILSMLDRRGTAVVLVDMQVHFLEVMGAAKRDRLVTAQRDLLNECVRKAVPVIVVEFHIPGKTPLCWLFEPGSTVPELTDVLAHAPHATRVHKADEDAFASMHFRNALTWYGARTLVCAGVNASACVRKTAVSAFRHGYRFLTAESLIADTRYSGTIKPATKAWYIEKGCMPA